MSLEIGSAIAALSLAAGFAHWLFAPRAPVAIETTICRCACEIVLPVATGTDSSTLLAVVAALVVLAFAGGLCVGFVLHGLARSSQPGLGARPGLGGKGVFRLT